MKKSFRVLISVIIFTSLAVTMLLVRERAPLAPTHDFTLLDGNKYSLTPDPGKPVLVTFWASTCSICLAEMPHLIELHREYAATGLDIIAVAMPYDPPWRVVQLARKFNLPYQVALDIDGKAVSAFGGVAGTPTTFLVSARGRILMSRVGEYDFPALRTLIETELGIVRQPLPARPVALHATGDNCCSG